MSQPPFFESHAPTLHKAWQRWKIVAAKIAEFQGRLLLTLIYILFVIPIGILLRLFGQDPLALRTKKKSYWVPRTPEKSIPESLQRQF